MITNSTTFNTAYVGKRNSPVLKSTTKSTAASTAASKTSSKTYSKTSSTAASTAASTTASTTAATVESTAASVDIDKIPTTVNNGIAKAITKGFVNGTIIKTSSTANVAFNKLQSASKTNEVQISKKELLDNTIEKFNINCEDLGFTQENRPTLKIRQDNIITIIEPDATTKTEISDEEVPATDMGCYDSNKHEITININNNGNNIDNINQTLSHELYHTKEALIRNSIPQEEKDKYIKQILNSKIENGEAPKIIMSIKGVDYMTMASPKFNDEISAQFLDFANENLYTDDETLLKDLTRYNELKYETKNKNQDLVEEEKILEEKLAPILNKIDDMAQTKEYVAKSANTTAFLNKEEKNKQELLKYTISIENRYQEFRKKENDNTISSDVKFSDEEAQKSIEENITSVEGNVVLENTRNNQNNSLKSKIINKLTKEEEKSFLQYYYSPEEMKARENSYNAQKTALKEELKFCTLKEKIKKKKEIKKIDLAIKLEKANYKNYNIQNEIRNNPKKLIPHIKKFALSIYITLLNELRNI